MFGALDEVSVHQWAEGGGPHRHHHQDDQGQHHGEEGHLDTHTHTHTHTNHGPITEDQTDSGFQTFKGLNTNPLEPAHTCYGYIFIPYIDILWILTISKYIYILICRVLVYYRYFFYIL